MFLQLVRAEAMGVGLVRGENFEMGTLENNTTIHQVRVFVQKKKKKKKKMGQEGKLRKNKEGRRTRRIRRESKEPNKEGLSRKSEQSNSTR